jgi:hypothetical protein
MSAVKSDIRQRSRVLETFDGPPDCIDYAATFRRHYSDTDVLLWTLAKLEELTRRIIELEKSVNTPMEAEQ